MDKKQEAFLLELISDFKIEAAEHHQAIVNGLLKLEKNPPEPELKELIETVFREIHSLKGASRAVEQRDIEQLCQAMEGVFHLVKQGTLTLTLPMYDALYKASEILGVMLLEVELKEKRIGNNILTQMVKRIEGIQFIKEPPPKIKLQDQPASVHKTQKSISPPISENIFQATEDLNIASSATNIGEKQVSSDTVRIATSKLEVLLREAEEFISVKATLGYYIREIKKRHNKELYALVKDMEQFHRTMSRMVDDLLLDIKTTLLYPFNSLLEIVPKIVRDLGKTYDKEINLSIQGGEIEIDRRILEEIKDPVIHLIRNCIDHGIETPQVRKQLGKSPSGSLSIIIRQSSGREVELLIQDDGCGVDKEKVIQSAVKMGITTADAAGKMTDKEVIALIFRSGVSTSPFITDISGRGLGMAIVAEKVSKLGGSIAMDSTFGMGTTFMITLPVTLSTFRGIMVRVSEQIFIIPTNAVERATRVHPDEIKTVESKQIITHNNESFALVRLGDVLGIPSRKIKNDQVVTIPALILMLAQKRIAFLVDEVMGEQEGIVKNLGPQLVHINNIAGATILGNGRVIPILNIRELMESAAQVSLTGMGAELTDEMETANVQSKYILVAEDSITLRSLLRNIIESFGYQVKTAVDGMEAFQFLKNETFDLVVSDVEMPRLNGFELTAKIRSDKLLADTPVILVTALDSADDRQRGMESGANAYIIKGSFEQSNLIEMIRRLI
jgi:two-component system chemotaxis sensor kinase CheA